MGSLNELMARTVSQTDPHSLKSYIEEWMKEADMNMGGKLTDEQISFLCNSAFKWLNERYNFMPLHHIKAALFYGSMGERGGTSTLIARNVNIWLRTQHDIMQEQIARQQKQEDEQRRATETYKWKPEYGFTGRAVIIKVGWLGEGKITSEEYDSFSSAKIRELLEQGYDERDIRPAMVVPDYEKHHKLQS